MSTKLVPLSILIIILFSFRSFFLIRKKKTYFFIVTGNKFYQCCKVIIHFQATHPFYNCFIYLLRKHSKLVILTTCIAQCQQVLSFRVDFMTWCCFVLWSANFVPSPHRIDNVTRSTIVTFEVFVEILACIWLNVWFRSFLGDLISFYAAIVD